MGIDVYGSDQILVGSDKNYRLSENPTIRSEADPNSILNKIHIADMRLTDRSEDRLFIIYRQMSRSRDIAL